jgi:riboflavin synthase
MLISHSQEIVTLTGKNVGDTVNVEVDCVGKYLLKGLGEGGVEALVDRLVERKLKERGM